MGRRPTVVFRAGVPAGVLFVRERVGQGHLHRIGSRSVVGADAVVPIRLRHQVGMCEGLLIGREKPQCRELALWLGRVLHNIASGVRRRVLPRELDIDGRKQRGPERDGLKRNLRRTLRRSGRVARLAARTASQTTDNERHRQRLQNQGLQSEESVGLQNKSLPS